MILFIECSILVVTNLQVRLFNNKVFVLPSVSGVQEVDNAICNLLFDCLRTSGN